MSVRSSNLKRLPREEKRKAILKEATALFLAHGYKGMSMNDLLARVGGSKANLYQHFENKEALFLNVIEDLIDQAVAPLQRLSFDEGLDLAEGLRRAASDVLEVLLAEDTVQLQVIMFWELRDQPEQLAKLYRDGPATLIDLLADFLRRHGDAVPTLRGAETRAAEYFVSLLLFQPMFQRDCKLSQTTDKDRRADYIDQVVSDFIKFLPQL